MARRRRTSAPGVDDIFKRPTSEQDMAEYFNYEYLEHDVINADAYFRMRVDVNVRRLVGMNGQASPCQCNSNPFGKCKTEDCINRGSKMACPVTCGPTCNNNPWIGYPPWQMGLNTYVFYDDNGRKGYGIRALSRIPKGSWICEYRGVFMDSGLPVLPEVAKDYQFEINGCDLVINSYAKGNGASLLNHSCYPNCQALQYAVDGIWSIVIVSIRDIEKDEEITYSYNLLVDHPSQIKVCYCKSKNCKKVLGKMRTGDRRYKVPEELAEPFEVGDPDPYGTLRRPNQENQQQAASSLITQAEAMPSRPRTEESSADNQNVPRKQRLQPYKFRSLLYDIQYQNTLRENPLPPIRPRIYVEDFIFDPMSTWSFYCVEDEFFTIALGTVVECDVNSSNQWFYVVVSNATEKRVHYVPRFMVYHYHEDAAYNYENEVYSGEDVGKMVEFLKLTPEKPDNEEACCGLRDAVVVDFAAKFEGRLLPEVRAIPSLMEGGLAVGQSPTALVHVNPDEDTAPFRPPAFDDGTCGRTFRPCANQPSDDPLDLSTRKSKRRRRGRHQSSDTGSDNDSDDDDDESGAGAIQGIGSPSPPPPQLQTQTPRRSIDESRQATRRSSTPKRHSREVPFTVMASGQEYNSFSIQHLTLKQVVKAYNNDTGFTNIIAQASSELTKICLSKLAEAARPSYQTVYMALTKFLLHWYVTVPPQYRRFLMFTHYLAAIEVEHPGSILMNWCPFCRPATNMTHGTQLHRHFQSHHSIAAFSYQCPSCGTLINQPSKYRHHLRHCDPDRASALILAIKGYICDAFADYLAKKGKNNMEIHIIPPGTPNLRVGRGCHESGNYEEMGPELEMDVATGLPLDANFKLEPLYFVPQVKYTEMLSWSELRYSSNKYSAAVVDSRGRIVPYNQTGPSHGSHPLQDNNDDNKRPTTRAPDNVQNPNNDDNNGDDDDNGDDQHGRGGGAIQIARQGHYLMSSERSPNPVPLEVQIHELEPLEPACAEEDDDEDDDAARSPNAFDLYWSARVNKRLKVKGAGSKKTPQSSRSKRNTRPTSAPAAPRRQGLRNNSVVRPIPFNLDPCVSDDTTTESSSLAQRPAKGQRRIDSDSDFVPPPQTRGRTTKRTPPPPPSKKQTKKCQQTETEDENLPGPSRNIPLEEIGFIDHQSTQTDQSTTSTSTPSRPRSHSSSRNDKKGTMDVSLTLADRLKLKPRACKSKPTNTAAHQQQQPPKTRQPAPKKTSREKRKNTEDDTESVASSVPCTTSKRSKTADSRPTTQAKPKSKAQSKKTQGGKQKKPETSQPKNQDMECTEDENAEVKSEECSTADSVETVIIPGRRGRHRGHQQRQEEDDDDENGQGKPKGKKGQGRSKK